MIVFGALLSALTDSLLLMILYAYYRLSKKLSFHAAKLVTESLKNQEQE